MPEHDAERGQQEVLGLEVAQDLAAGRAQRAAHADLLGALLHPEAGQADDAQRGHHQQRDAHRDQQPRHRAVVAVVVVAQLLDGLVLSSRMMRLGLLRSQRRRPPP